MTLDVDARARRDRARRRRAARPRRRRGGVGHRAHRQRQHGQRHPPRARRPRRRPARRSRSIAYGGNGAVHAGRIAAELGIDRILVPKAAPAFSALGVLVADYVVDLRARVRRAAVAGRPRPAARRSCTSSRRGRARSSSRPASAEAQVDVSLFAQMCYPGQNFDMSVPVPEGDALDEPGLLDLAERFHDQHEADRGFCFRNQQPLVRGVRLVARGTHARSPTASPSSGTVTDAAQARTGSRPVVLRRRASSTRRSTTAPRSAPGADVDGPGARSRSRSPSSSSRRARPPASTSSATTSSPLA